MRARILAAVAVAALVTGGVAYADPVDDIRHTVADIKVDRLPPGATGGAVSSAVVGYIQITQNAAMALPSYVLHGALADPTLWTCSDNGAALPYAVTCVPASTAVNLTWHCDVLHANINTTSVSGRARASLDCDGYATPAEAQTAIVTGPYGIDVAWAQSNVLVTQFSCTVDGGILPAAPDYTAFCGDPGAPTVG